MFLMEKKISKLLIQKIWMYRISIEVKKEFLCFSKSFQARIILLQDFELYIYIYIYIYIYASKYTQRVLIKNNLIIYIEISMSSLTFLHVTYLTITFQICLLPSVTFFPSSHSMFSSIYSSNNL